MRILAFSVAVVLITLALLAWVIMVPGVLLTIGLGFIGLKLGEKFGDFICGLKRKRLDNDS